MVRRLKIVVSPDSFKDSCSAQDAAAAIARGCLKADSDIQVVQLPVSDGGEGLLKCLNDKLELVSCQVSDPLGRAIPASYGIIKLNGSKTAVIEMATAAGLELLQQTERNPLYTTTYGVGELILHAYFSGVRNFMLGLGGSATSDCGSGMAQTLGIKFIDKAGDAISKKMTAALNAKVADIDTSNFKLDISECAFTVVCDVKNILLGPDGAAYTYAGQKGASPAQIAEIEASGKNIADIIEKQTDNTIKNIEGSGAAGGLAVPILAFMNGKVQSGIDTILELLDFHSHIKDADLIITGEGTIDATSTKGKTISGIINAAKGTPVIALCGQINGNPEQLLSSGLTEIISITPVNTSLEQALADTTRNLELVAEKIIRSKYQ